MAGLETQIRKALTDQRTEEFIEFTLKDLEYKSMITELAETCFNGGRRNGKRIR